MNSQNSENAHAGLASADDGRDPWADRDAGLLDGRLEKLMQKAISMGMGGDVA